MSDTEATLDDEDTGFDAEGFGEDDVLDAPDAADASEPRAETDESESALEDAGDGADGSDPSESGDFVTPGERPQPPEGYASWEEVATHAQQAEARSRELAPMAQFGQQVLTQQQPQPEDDGKFPGWKLPHELDPHLAVALELRHDPEKFSTLPADLQKRAVEFGSYVEGNHERWRLDPPSFVRDVVDPHFRPEITMLRREISELRAESVRRQHSDVLSSPEAEREFVRLSLEGVPQKYVLEFMRLQAQLAERSEGDRKRDMGRKDREARHRSSRGRKARDRKPQTRSGDPKISVPKAKRGDAKAVLDAVLKAERERGEA